MAQSAAAVARQASRLQAFRSEIRRHGWDAVVLTRAELEALLDTVCVRRHTVISLNRGPDWTELRAGPRRCVTCGEPVPEESDV